MSSETMEIRIQGDENGAMRLCCPICNDEFKVYISNWKNLESDTIYCAICGLSRVAKDFYPQEVRDTIIEHAPVIAQQMLYDAFKSLKGNKFIKIKVQKPKPPPPIQDIKTNNTNDTSFTCAACKKEYRVPNFSESQKTYCPFCGELV